MKGLLLKPLLIQCGQNQTYQRLKIPKCQQAYSNTQQRNYKSNQYFLFLNMA